MNLFETVKAAVHPRMVAERYGLPIRQGSMVCCPFHADRTPSMKLNEDYFYCFGCGASGDVIDLAARLFGLSGYDAAKKLSADFGITGTSKARILDGVVKARKDSEDGKPEAYKVAVGTGFDEELFTVQPGAILLAGESAEDNEADDALSGAANTTEGL